MNGMTRLIGAAAAGAAGMYLLDPDRGRRRRALARDKVISAVHQLGDASQTTARDLANRARGTAARLRSLALRRPVSDRQIAERVRSTLGFVLRHPRAVDVSVEDGRVILAGPILADEENRLLTGVASIGGVRSIDNRLRVHREPGTEPGLQGEPARPRRGRAFPMMQRVWSPTTRLFAMTTGASLAVWGLRRAGPDGLTAALGGLALFLRGATNLELKRIVGVGAGHQAVTLQKTVNINAPVEQVFAAWSRYEDFPKFMSHVRDRPGTDDRSGLVALTRRWHQARLARLRSGWRPIAGSRGGRLALVRLDLSSRRGRIATADGHDAEGQPHRDGQRGQDRSTHRPCAPRSLAMPGAHVSGGRLVGRGARAVRASRARAPAVVRRTGSARLG
jgi:hypothetical protein